MPRVSQPDMAVLSRLLNVPAYKGLLLFNAGTKPYLVFRNAARERREMAANLRQPVPDHRTRLRQLPKADSHQPRERMIPMTLIDLSLPIYTNMPVYPGDSGVTITRAKASNENGIAVQVSTVLMGCHAGTHLDAPRHFIKDGATVADLPLDRFACPALVVACPWRPGEPLDFASADLEAMQPGDALIVATGWDKRATSAEYYEQIPEFAPGTTERLLQLGIRLFGLDLPTVREAIHPGESASPHNMPSCTSACSALVSSSWRAWPISCRWPATASISRPCPCSSLKNAKARRSALAPG